jgi:hypothetical protein
MSFASFLTNPSEWNVSAWHDDIVGIPCTVYAVHVTNRSEIALLITRPIEPRYYFEVESSTWVSDKCGGNTLGGGISVTCTDLVNVLDPSDLRTWRYHDTGIDPGPNWMQPSFDDTSWKSGPQVFDSDPARQTVEGWPVRTRLAVDVPNSNPPQRIPTFVFRVHLSLPNDFRAYNLIGRALHDDGFVLYVNGHEAFRRGANNDQFNAFGGTVESTANTVQQPFIVSGSNLIAGDNVIAIQLKQANAESADATFGLQLQLLGLHFVPPPHIIIQPQSQTIAEGHTWFMEVVSSGGWNYQWFHNGLAIPGAYGSRLTGVAWPTNTGDYRVEVSSLFGSVMSEAATLQVRPLVLPYGATWRYQTNQQDATLTGTPWYATTFDDSSWPTAPGPFGWDSFGTAPGRLPTPIATLLSVPDPGFRTAYFRARVNIPHTPAGQTLMLCHYIDDGAAFYVDGQLALRYNLTNALPIYSTNATATSTPGTGNALVVCVPFPLEAGEHLLAFEVHQARNSTDVMAGLELRLVTPPPPTSLAINRDASGNYFLEWNPDPFWELVQSTHPSGPYLRYYSGPSGRITLFQPSTNRFFQLRFNGW